jgi:hypothetical protein
LQEIRREEVGREANLIAGKDDYWPAMVGASRR